jgi:hypothetical protein
MKALLSLKALAAIIVLTISIMPAQVFAQGSNEIAVRDGEGRPVPGVVVMIFEPAAPKCACNGNQCVPRPLAAATTNRNGIASFRGELAKRFKPNTDYIASINATCQTVRACSNSQQDCVFQATAKNIKTDDKAKFPGCQITK